MAKGEKACNVKNLDNIKSLPVPEDNTLLQCQSSSTTTSFLHPFHFQKISLVSHKWLSWLPSSLLSPPLQLYSATLSKNILRPAYLWIVRTTKYYVWLPLVEAPLFRVSWMLPYRSIYKGNMLLSPTSASFFWDSWICRKVIFLSWLNIFTSARRRGWLCPWFSSISVLCAGIWPDQANSVFRQVLVPPSSWPPVLLSQIKEARPPIRERDYIFFNSALHKPSHLYVK